MARTRTLRRTWPGIVPAALAAVLAACASVQQPGGAGSQPAAGPGAAALGAPATAPLDRRAGDRFADGVRREAAGDLAGAAAEFEAALASEPRMAWAGLNAGRLREALKQPEAARAAYQRALDGSPGFVPAAQNLARLEIRAGRAAQVEADLRARLEKTPDSVALRNALSEVLLATGNLAGAEEAARRALKTDEKNVPAMVNLAAVYQRKKRFELARMVLENARQVDGSDAAVWNRIGAVELELGNVPQALEAFKTAATLRPDYPEAQANYGAMLADAEDYEGAISHLERAVHDAPGLAAAWLNLGNAYRGAKRFMDAEAAYARAQALDPKMIEVQFNLAVLFLDGERPGTATLARLEQGVAYLDAFEASGGKDGRLPEYRKDALRSVDREKKRLAREEKDRLRREADAKRKADEAAAQAAQQEAQPQPAVAPAEQKAAPVPATAPAPGAKGTPGRGGSTKGTERGDR
ncbi:MAG: tetratricopeptide repeat protein [Anaeromyxobacter sp.]